MNTDITMPVVVIGSINKGIYIQCSMCEWRSLRAADPDRDGHMPESASIARDHIAHAHGGHPRMYVATIVFDEAGEILHDRTAAPA